MVTVLEIVEVLVEVAATGITLEALERFLIMAVELGHKEIVVVLVDTTQAVEAAEQEQWETLLMEVIKEEKAAMAYLILELLMLEAVGEAGIPVVTLVALEAEALVMEAEALVVKHKAMQHFLVAVEELVVLKAGRPITVEMGIVE